MTNDPARRSAVITFGIGYLTLGALVLVLTLGLLGWVQYWRLQATVDHACRSAVTIDLTSWAPVCRVLQPEDLDR